MDVVGLTSEQVRALRDERGGAVDVLAIVQATMLREAEALRRVDLPALAASVPQPVLLLLGSGSPRWAASVTSDLADALPAARVAVLDGQGHEAVDDDPRLVAAHLDRFLGAADPLPGSSDDPPAPAVAP